ncbi:parvalbumin-like EF-hand-containing protein [Carcharodon carcharias]|uniref:parvalbumin-like EF-hand-containing protein n=1 Tax=Carcharodon carcharias TaxID=13397 RepID=UPI001B7F6130|nr:parvalbumin-like EF-hand-containing protein [Carcharodon carcharias]
MASSDFSAQVKQVAHAMGTSLTDHDISLMPSELRLKGPFNYHLFFDYMEASKKSGQLDETIRKAFETLDKDKSGYIEWNELKYILSTIPTNVPIVPLSDEEADAMLQAADIDGDGRINYKEFEAMVKEDKMPRKK